nr:putative B3 domain-containing protein At1g78640 [Ipomoea batatas]
MERLVCSTTRRVEDDDPQAGVIPPLSAASVWCSNDDVHPYPYQESPLVLALPVPNHHDQEEITKLTLFTGSEEDHPTAAPRIEDHLPIKKRKRFIILGSKKPKNNSIQVQEKEEEGVIIAKRQKKKVVDKNPPTGALGNHHHHHHHHWIHKRLSTSDVNLSSRLLLPKEEIIKYVLPLMDMESRTACENRDGLRVKIWDLDTESEHQLSLRPAVEDCQLSSQ